jgi:hypothetical protein
MKPKGRPVILLLSAGCLILIPPLWGLHRARAAGTQGGPVPGGKLVEVAPETMWDAVWVTKVTVGDKFLLAPYGKILSPLPNEIIPGHRFLAGDDWLKNMTIYVENRTDKNIAWLEVSLRFPETGNGRTQPVWDYRIQLGRMPAADAFDGRTGKPLHVDPKAQPLNLKPGQVLVVRVADYMNRIRAYLETAMPLWTVTRCYIYIADCLFADGMGWGGGAYSVPDPAHPGKWRHLGQRYFPGNPHRYLPNVVTGRPGQAPQP